MFNVPRNRETDRPDNPLGMLIVSLVAMAFLFGFGVATLVFRLEGHGRPDAVIPALILSFTGVIVQFGILRTAIRRLEQGID